MGLGERIRSLRKTAKLTQEELCAAAGFSKKVIQDIESGQGNPTLESLISISDVLKVPTIALFGGDESPARSTLLAAIVEALPALDDRELRMILTRIESLPAKARPGRSTSG